jgi:hypothetical protein
MNPSLLRRVLLVWTSCIAIHDLTFAIHEQPQQQHYVLPVTESLYRREAGHRKAHSHVLAGSMSQVNDAILTNG